LLRRLDVDWKATLAEWSNYDLDSVEREIQEEKARRVQAYFEKCKKSVWAPV